MKINSISASDNDFPKRLVHIPKAPKQIHVAGTLPTEDRPHVTIVGTRRPTAYGRAITEQIAGGLAIRGVVVVSGMAFGIDAIAHQACLKQNGTTIAVLPSDLHKPYPRTHHSLSQEIVGSGGALISEYNDNPMPAKWSFLARNRIVSGLSDILVVTEATTRSGTMSTVAHALEQGRDVYALPGPITSPLSQGCNRMIAQGATPITDVDEFLESIAPRHQQIELLHNYSDEEYAIVKWLEQGISDGEEILAKSELEAGQFQQTMTMLEIKGHIHALGANNWRL